MSEEQSLREIRLEKLQRMIELGHDPYAVESFAITHSAQQLLDRFEELQSQSERFAGRVVSYRLMGKAGFAHVSDGDAKIQAYFRKDDLGDLQWELYELLDIGDHVGIVGELFLTKTGEKTLHVRELVPLSKSLQVLPLGKEKDGQHWYGLSDIDQRYRHRHLDLVCNPEARKALLDRSRIVSAVRKYFASVNYLEVETPLLQVIAGGAAARPFVTHYNAYSMEVKLRISLELYLKRLICGDIPRVFEVGRVFRNEGVSNRHSPEFTLLEFYEAYSNLDGMMKRVEELFAFVARDVFGTLILNPIEGGPSMDFGEPWKRVDLLEEIERHTGLTPHELRDLESAKEAGRHRNVEKAASDLGAHIDLKSEDTLGGFIEKLLEVFVEPTLQEPTFVVGYPIETSPLAKKDPKNMQMTRRFEGYILGREVCNAFSEINDPIDQKERFEEQARQLAKGNPEAHPMDEEYIFALESGMPPTGGCGIGMERMAMVLTGTEQIREVLFFPLMKPIADREDQDAIP